MLLHDIKEDYAGEIFALVDNNRDDLRQWLPWVDGSKKVDDTLEFIRKAIDDKKNNKAAIYVMQTEGNICGVCGFNSFQHDIKAGFPGYWLAPKYRGKGLMHNACRELLEIGFNQMGLNKVEIYAAEGNRPSRNVAERLGCELTGKLLDAEMLNGRYVDFMIYCLRRANWRK